MQDNLTLILQWREIDQNNYLASHVGGATNIFRVVECHDGTCGDQKYDHDNDDYEVNSGKEVVYM